MSRTPPWRRALPAPRAGRVNMRIHYKQGYGDSVVEGVFDLRDLPSEGALDVVRRARQLVAPPVAASGETVHMLSQGVTLCWMPGVPADWPPGHSWVARSEAHLVTCPKCVEAAKPPYRRTRRRT